VIGDYVRICDSCWCEFYHGSKNRLSKKSMNEFALYSLLSIHGFLSNMALVSDIKCRYAEMKCRFGRESSKWFILTNIRSLQSFGILLGYRDDSSIWFPNDGGYGSG
jgi:hypothetical protein